jgi:phosphoenolpyruvate-protein phosphotransferase
MRRELIGHAAAPGVAHGPALLVGATEWPPLEVGAHEVGAALDQVADELETSAHEAGGDLGAILLADAAIARDPQLRYAIADALASAPADVAIPRAFADTAKQLRSLGGILAERAADLEAIERRLRDRLLGQRPSAPLGAVIVATDLGPPDLAALASSSPRGLVLGGGSPTAHVAILARSMGIPAVTGARGIDTVQPGELVLVDGDDGRVVVDPSEDDLVAHDRRGAARAPRGAAGAGVSVALAANVASRRDAEAGSAVGAEGIGLLRTEFLFLGRSGPPSLDEQVTTYRELLDPFAGARCIVRTLDVGSDKPLAYLPLPSAANPALGVRGWRAWPLATELLETQLAAIARAGREARVRLAVMAPMVTSVAEARAAVAAIRAAGIEEAGVMVEVPALALMGRELASAVDFVSLGTNDLAQYLFAADREDAAVAALADPFSPALARLIATLVADLGAAIPIGVCGEMAGDPLAAVVLAGLGVTSLSMTPTLLPRVRERLGATTAEQARRCARAVLAAADAAQARAAMHDLLDSA